MSIAVFSIDVKIFWVYSHHTFILFKRILLVRLYTFCVFGEEFVYLTTFRNLRTLKDFRRILLTLYD
jgi:hypothetical protein